jgi:hypothetical protein
MLGAGQAVDDDDIPEEISEDNRLHTDISMFAQSGVEVSVNGGFDKNMLIELPN